MNRQPHLRGEVLELRPLRADDWDALFAVASDPLIWEQHPESTRYQEATFRQFFNEGLASGGALVARDADPLRPRRYMSIAPIFFKNPAAFRAWLQKHHRTETELWVGYWKKATGRPSLTWQESVDEALCFGWIDGIRKSIDADSYTNRFTPRRRGSVWSAVNERRAAELFKSGRMRAAGKKAFEARDPSKTVVYQYELDPPLLASFKAHRAAWSFFEDQPPGYRKRLIWRVMSAKQHATRVRRLEEVIAMCAAGRRFEMMPSARKNT